MTLYRISSNQWLGAGIAPPRTLGKPMREILRQDEIMPEPHSAVDDGPNQRSAPRFTLLIRAAKLLCGDAEFLCVVRDASDSGISVRTFHPLPSVGELALELPNGDRFPLVRVWEEEGKAGFRFVGDVDLTRIVESPSPFNRRGMRVRMEVPCRLAVGLRKVPAMIHNLSQQGALISTDEKLSLIERVKVLADGMPEVAGKVRWRRNDQYGLSFEDTFQFAQLAALAFELQRTN